MKISHQKKSLQSLKGKKKLEKYFHNYIINKNTKLLFKFLFFIKISNFLKVIIGFMNLAISSTLIIIGFFSYKSSYGSWLVVGLVDLHKYCPCPSSIQPLHTLTP